jgi:hypothetical protein
MLGTATWNFARWVLRARWSEFDLEKAQWVIPAARMKSRRPHRVYLARQVPFWNAVARQGAHFVTIAAAQLLMYGMCRKSEAPASQDRGGRLRLSVRVARLRASLRAGSHRAASLAAWSALRSRDGGGPDGGSEFRNASWWHERNWPRH